MAHLPMGWDKMETFPLLVHSATEYAGPFVIVDGKLDRILFDGGYCTVRDSQPKYHFYVRDHLGSIRVVVDEDGKVEQKTYYYPFGGIYGNVSAGTDVQPFKYNGKELDHRHGLDLYDYGARQYDAATGRWTTMDPLAEKYYSVSPYTYCHNNPVNLIDPDGRNPIYNSKGEFLGVSSEGFTGQIYIYTGVENLDFSSNNIAFWTDRSDNTPGYGFDFKTFDEVERSYTGKAKANFVSNVLTNVVSHFNGIKVFDDRVFNVNTLKGGRIGFTKKKDSNLTTLRKHDGIKTEITAHDDITTSYEGTVENFAASIIIHEWYSHGEYKVGNTYHNHYKAYQNVQKDKLFYPKTTERYREFVKISLNYYLGNKN